MTISKRKWARRGNIWDITEWYVCRLGPLDICLNSHQGVNGG